MADLTIEEINEAKKQLSGPRIVFWISLIVTALGAIGAIFNIFLGNFDFIASWISVSNITLLSVAQLVWFLIWVVLSAIELVFISNRKPAAIGLGRFLLVIIMIFTFPIGTIIGAVVWKRFSHPVAQKYLNYSK
jgi:hypothetical protein